MTIETGFPVYAYTHFADGAPMYVAQVKGDGGADWGYTSRIGGSNGFDLARPLSKYWWQRFAKDQRECGRCAFSIPAD